MSQSLSAKVDGVDCNGLEGLNLSLTAPFNFMDSVIGIKGKINDLRNLKAETVFVRKSIEGIDFDVDYDFGSQDISAGASWSDDQFDISVQANNRDYLTGVSAAVKRTLDEGERNIKTRLSAAYDVLTGKTDASLNLAQGDAALQMDYDTASQEPVIGFSYQMDKNTIQPSFNLKTGKVEYGLNRKLETGSINAALNPGENVVVEWKDDGAKGTWKTKLDYPLNNGNTKVSFARDFNM